MYMSILSRLNEAQKFSSAYFVFMFLLLHIRSFVSEYTSLRPSLYICFAVYAFLVLLFLFSHIPHPLLVCSGGSYCTLYSSRKWCSSFHLVFMSFERNFIFRFTIFHAHSTIHAVVVRFELREKKKSVSAVV